MSADAALPKMSKSVLILSAVVLALTNFMRVNWLLPSRMVTRSAGPGTTVTTPPPRSSTALNCGTATVSSASAGAEAASAATNSGRIERIANPFFICATYVALQMQRV